MEAAAALLLGGQGRTALVDILSLFQIHLHRLRLNVVQTTNTNLSFDRQELFMSPSLFKISLVCGTV